jgi:hypothetical protein
MVVLYGMPVRPGGAPGLNAAGALQLTEAPVLHYKPRRDSVDSEELPARQRVAAARAAVR